MVATIQVPGRAHAAELVFAGVLGNSGGSGPSLVTFADQPAAGMGPVIDEDAAIWERGGSTRLNRYALDGRLLASYPLPESTGRNDQLTRVGPVMLMQIRTALYSLPLDAVAGSTPQRLDGKADVMSSNAFAGRVVVFETNRDQLFWFDPSTGQRMEIAKPGMRVIALHVGDDGTVYAFDGRQVQAWRDGAPVAGFPIGFRGERPQQIGRYWYAHGWHGTIHRMNERFEPEPGVVLGGASGSFIGYLPESADLANGRGLAHVRDDVYAVSGLGGVVQLLRWNDVEQRFELARRIGALAKLTGVALDERGDIWTPLGSWRWDDTCEVPHTVGDKEPNVHAQPVVLNGQTLCVLRTHYRQVHLALGACIDSNGWSRLETRRVDDLDLAESVSGAAAIPSDDGLSLLVVRQDGQAVEMGITAEGRQRSKPEPVTIEGLNQCTSLAWFDGRLVAAADGAVIAYQRDGDQRWTETSRIADYDGKAYVHSDGRRLAVCDSAGGTLRLFDADLSPVAAYDGLDAPMHVAVSGDRVVVYEAGRQRLVKLQLAERHTDPPVGHAEALAVRPTETGLHTDVDFQDFSRPAGLPFAVAITPDQEGLAISIRTRAESKPELRLGIANDKQAFVLTGGTGWQTAPATAGSAADEQGRMTPRRQVDFRLPAGDWSRLRFAATIETPRRRERFGFQDHRALHAPFSTDPADWALFDWEDYRESVSARRQEIRIAFQQPSDGKATLVIEDESGRRVRNLVSGRSFTGGWQTLVWDGLDEQGKLVPPGRYHWRGITHPGIEPVYRMNFANGGEDTTAPWGPNHSTFHHAATNGELVFFAAPVTEGGWALVALDADGNFVQGYEHLHGYGIGHDAIAADDQYLYCAQDGFTWGGTKGVDLGSDNWTATWKLTLVRYDIASGKIAEFPGKRRALEVDTMQVGPGAKHPNLDEFNLGGLAIQDGKLYVGSRDKQAVLVLDAATGQRLESLPLPGVRHLTAGTEIYAATDHGVVRVRDGKTVVSSADIASISQGEPQLSGITIAPNGDLLVSEAKSHQIYRFAANGSLVATIGAPGGPYKGAYDPKRMVHPAGLVFGPDGKLWVTEKRWNPKRVLAWDAASTSNVVYEKFGMPHYGGDGSGFDPQNPRRWIGLGCFWDVDVEQGTARPTHILSFEEGHFGNYEPHSYLFFREAGRTFVCARGKISLISEVLPDGTLHDILAVAGTHHFAYGCQWAPPQAYIDAFYAKWPEKRAREKPGMKGDGKPWSQRGMGVLWVDRNGDGQAQQEEFDFCGDNLALGDGAWGHLQTSLTLYMPLADKDQASIVAIRPRGFLPNGVPNYPSLDEAIAEATPIDLTPGYKRNGVPTVRDRFGRFIFNSDPEMNAYQTDVDGATAKTLGPPTEPRPSLWSFPNRWSNVHGSHRAPLPEPGVMQGTLGILGLASLDDQSDVFFLNGNHGRCFLLTSDGLYLDEVFVDVRVSYQNNEYRLGGEIFGGSFGRSETDGKYFVQIGHGPYRIYQLAGLSDVARVAGSIDVTKEQILAAQRQNLRRVAESQTAKQADVPGTVRWDKSGQFHVELDLAADATHLHLHYRVEDRSPWVNNGRDWTKLFATGDSVDLQIATDPTRSPKRSGPAEGDKRLMIAPLEGRPIAVLYEHRKPGGENPIEFTSPWRGEKVDNVRRLPDATIEAKTSGGGYEVKASVLLSDLGLQPQPGQTYRADFGVTYGDAEGTDTNLRSYWSNHSTGLVDDIPGEIMLSPNLWGEVRFQPDESTPAQ
ncbi:NHL repeat protein [Stieleria neptunia]|uniref:NHL repeat protein n=1 Tax=Stieleria neptunia TaxID=2527979 RepID=A0A518HJQ5_9BACT|nr:FlgD immunoglobulin-like domain containing protein [Stieleria neptunia]QDV41063.1 NHL repeat protein [Stieleria neptunia]